MCCIVLAGTCTSRGGRCSKHVLWPSTVPWLPMCCCSLWMTAKRWAKIPRVPHCRSVSLDPHILTADQCHVILRTFRCHEWQITPMTGVYIPVCVFGRCHVLTVSTTRWRRCGCSRRKRVCAVSFTTLPVSHVMTSCDVAVAAVAGREGAQPLSRSCW